jgi:hypothetical protein
LKISIALYLFSNPAKAGPMSHISSDSLDQGVPQGPLCLGDTPVLDSAEPRNPPLHAALSQAACARPCRGRAVSSESVKEPDPRKRSSVLGRSGGRKARPLRVAPLSGRGCARPASESAAHADEVHQCRIVVVVHGAWPLGFRDSRSPGSRGVREKAPASAPGKAGGWGCAGGYACAAAVAGCAIFSVSRMTWKASRITVPSSRVSALPSASVLAGL